MGPIGTIYAGDLIIANQLPLGKADMTSNGDQREPLVIDRGFEIMTWYPNVNASPPSMPTTATTIPGRRIQTS